ncbi:MAG: IS1634 family transposase [Bacillota bacterium]|nr:IS1634 family transposase [Bacillota bacterium]MDW7677894.1 IS1634 family transposase [Bacillota bacterium]
MYLKQIPNKKSGRIFLSIVEPYRHKESGNTRTKTVLALGYLDELEKEMDDPISHYKQVAKEMTEEKKDRRHSVKLECSMGDTISQSVCDVKNIGYLALSRIYHELGLHTFMASRQRRLGIDYQLNSVLKMLVYQRVLDPGSKKYTFERRERYCETYDFSLADVYRSLNRFADMKDGLLKHLHKSVTKNYSRDTKNVFYDVTNYYFEIDEPDELRKKGVSKEHQPSPIVQLGLLMDQQGLPITYKLFSGNTNDCQTLLPVLSEVRREYGIDRMVVVADRGLNTADNIAYNLLKGDGYVFSQTVRGANQELKRYVLRQSDYRGKEDGFKIKSRVYPRTISVTSAEGKKVDVSIDEKQVVFYSDKYARRAKAEREPALLKAQKIIDSPSLYNKSSAYGAAKYIKDLVFDKVTGEVISAGRCPQLNLDRLREEEKWDGYYVIVTSELDLSDEQVIDTYRGLWQIEEAFKVTKSELATRPVYVSRHERIEAHFLSCFIGLLMLRVLELKTKRQFSPARIIESLNRANGMYVEEGLYVFSHFDEVLEKVGLATGINFDLKYRSKGDIRSLVASSKKV